MLELKKIIKAIKEFFVEDGIDKASVLAYYSIVSFLFLFSFAIQVLGRYIGRLRGGSLRGSIEQIYPFTPDFLSKISPDFLVKAQEIADKLDSIGTIGIVVFAFFGFLVIKKLVQFINEMFHTHIVYKGLFMRRISEIGFVFVMLLTVILSSLLNYVVSFVNRLINNNSFIIEHINRKFLDLTSNFFIGIVLPFILTFIFIFFIYKWVPEKKIYVRGAFFSALLSSILWEVVKRLYTYYLMHVSLLGKIKGPIIGIILFGFWMEISMTILLFGAKLTYILDKEHDSEIVKNS